MNRRGQALLLALVLTIALLILGAAVLDLADRRLESARREAIRVRLRAAGRSALSAAIAQLVPDSALMLTPGESGRLDSTSPATGMVVLDSVTRIDWTLFQASGTAWQSSGGGRLEARDATRELFQLIEILVADTMAILAAGPLVVEGAAMVSGVDLVSSSAPACSASSTAGPGAVLGPPMRVQIDSPAGATVVGSPPFVMDTTAGPAMLDRLASAPFRLLAGAAGHSPSALLLTPMPSLTGSTCDTSDSLNWGDPTARLADCGGYRPMIRLAAHSAVAGGLGQGVLVATGRLRLGGAFRYEGIVLVQGVVVVEDSAVIAGVVVAGDSVIVRGNAVVNRSRCAIEEAKNAVAGRRSRVPRGWSRGP